MIYRVNTDKETEQIGAKLAQMLIKLGKKRAYIAMRGEMGVGKTVFTRGFASQLGIVGIKSPTYTIVNEHRGYGVKLYHFDLYRIADEDDLESIGYYEYVEGDGYSVVEWSERVPECIPEDAITVTISRTPDNDEWRDIEITGIDMEG